MVSHQKIILGFMKRLRQHVDMRLIKTVYLRGSVARGDATLKSDVDISIIWYDELVTEKNVASFVTQLARVVEVCRKEYGKRFSVPKIMSYKCWKANIHFTYVRYGQELLHYGKVLYGEPLNREVQIYKPDDEFLDLLLYKSLLMELSYFYYFAHYYLWKNNIENKAWMYKMKNYYGILRIYNQLITKQYNPDNNQLLESVSMNCPDQKLLEKLMDRKVPLYIENQSDNMMELIELINEVYVKAARNFKPGFGLKKDIKIAITSPNPSVNPPVECDLRQPLQKILQRIETFIRSRENTHLLIGFEEFREDYFDFHSLDNYFAKSIKMREQSITIDERILKLYVQNRWSYITYNWVNKLIEYKLNPQIYNFDYIYDHFQLHMMKKDYIYVGKHHDLMPKIFHSDFKEMLGGNKFSFEKLVVLHYGLEKDIFKDQLLPIF